MDKRTIALTDQPTYAGTYYVPVDDPSFSEARKMALSVILGTESTTRAANDVLITVGAGLGSTGAYTAYANSWYLRAADFTTGITDRGGASANLVNSLFNADRILDAYIHDIYDLWEVGAGVGSVEQKGNSNLASGVASLCVNGDNIASGDYSTCFGRYNTVAGDYSISSGSGNANAGDFSYSFGNNCTINAGADYTFVWGRYNTVSGSCATALGYYSIASGDYSFAGGTRIAGAFGSIASGECSFCFGGGDTKNTEAGGAYSAILGGNDNDINAGGTYSGIIGGVLNTVSDDRSVICGGASNAIDSGADKSFIGGGDSNETNSTKTAIIGGESHFIDGASDYSGIYTGRDGAIVGTYSTILGGRDNTIQGDYSSILGGYDNLISSDYSAICGRFNEITVDKCFVSGFMGKSTFPVSRVHGFGDVYNPTTGTTKGSFQKIESGQYSFTTDATPTILYIANTAATGKLVIPTRTLWQFTIRVAALQTGGTSGTVMDSFTQTIKGAIKNIAGTTSIVGSTLAETAIKDAAFGGTVAVSADDVNDCLQIQVTGEADKNITWTASVELVQVKY